MIIPETSAIDQNVEPIKQCSEDALPGSQEDATQWTEVCLQDFLNRSKIKSKQKTMFIVE